MGGYFHFNNRASVITMAAQNPTEKKAVNVHVSRKVMGADAPSVLPGVSLLIYSAMGKAEPVKRHESGRP